MGLLQSSSRVIGLIKIAIIARILTPHDFGTFGLIVLAVGISEIFSDLGIQTFLIQSKKNTDAYINSGWVLQLIRGALLTVIIIILAQPLSLFFKQSDLIFLIILGALNPLIKGFENLYVIKFQKELMFHKELIYRLVIVIADFIVSIIFALLTHSVMALIIGMLASSLVGVLYSWIFIKEKPLLDFNLNKIKQIMHFSKWTTTNGIIYYLTTQLDSIIIGKFMGTANLGLYQISQKFSLTPMQEIADIFGKVSFPFYSKISHDLQRFKKAYLKTLLGLIFIELGVGIVLYLFSKTIILILLGSQWIGTDALFKLFVVYGFFAAIIGTNGAFFLSVGRQDILTKLSLLRIVVLIPTIIFGVSYLGTQGAVYALLGSLILIAPLSFILIILLLKRKIAVKFSYE